MTEIKSIVKNVIDNICHKRLADDSKIERIWTSILDQREARHAKFIGMKDGVIFIQVDSPARLFQMKIKKIRMLKKIQEENPDIKGISFKIGRIA